MTIAMCDDYEHEKRQQDTHQDQEDIGRTRPHFTFDQPLFHNPFDFVQYP